MFTQWIKASAASFFLIVGTLAMFDTAGAHQVGVPVDQQDVMSS